MAGFTVLDIILVVILLGYLVYGFRAGLVLSIGSIIGIAVGAVAAFFAIPLVNTWVTDAIWRVPATLLVALVLLFLGQSLGVSVGRLLRRGVDRTPLRIIDRLLGAAVDLVVAALLMSMLAFSVASLGVPVISQAIASSAVIRTIDGVTPDPVKAAMAQLRSAVVHEGFPRLIGAPESGPVAVPDVNTDTPALAKAAESVVKVTGNAWECGQNQSGSGFVVAPGRVVTNAHVVAGVSEPVVQVMGGQTWSGRVVSFDPQRDLAVIAVHGLPVAPLKLTDNLSAGDTAVFDGFPLGGPFASGPASVRRVSMVDVPNIYGTNPTPLELYSLAATVKEGNSGGPLLNSDGEVAGVVFAKSVDRPSIGYALTMKELAPVVESAESFNTQVASGHCTTK